MKTVNIGVIGTGGIANAAHLPSYKDCPNANILALCDINENALRTTQEKYGVKHVFTDYRELLKMDEIDAVSVCTPNYMHMEPAIAALCAGKHVLVEKPLAMNADEGQRIVDAAKAAGKKCQVGFVMRFGADAQVLKRYIQAGDLGSLYYSRAQILRRRGIPGWGVFGQKDKQGGGPLIDLGVHILDLTLWLMGHPKPVSVSGMTCTKFGNREGVVGLMGQWDVSTFTVEDFGVGFIRFEDGSSMTLESAFAANIKAETQHQISILGDRGGADLLPLSIYHEEHGVLVDTTPVFVPQVKGFQAEINSFVNAVANDTPVEVPVEHGLMVSKILDGIYRSSELGEEVAIV